MSAARRAFVMVWDGMRPDLISEEHTPNLWRLGADGVRFAESHAVFPTVTRINSASLATGRLPAGHGILGNSVFVQAVDPRAAINMGDHRALAALRELRGGRIVLCDTLADHIGERGGRTVVVSTGSPGSAMLCHPRIDERSEAGDRLLHPVIPTPPDALATAIERLGPMPAVTIPNQAQNRWFTRAIVEHVLPDLDPTLLVFWHTDPDKTQHARGFGSPEGMASIRDADTHLGMVLAALAERGILAETTAAVVSDHGYVTIDPLLDAAGPDGPFTDLALSTALDDGRLVLARNGGALYVSAPDGDASLIGRAGQALLAWPAGGPVFARAFPWGSVEGTFPLSSIGLDGEHAPDLLCSLAWDDAVNMYGRAGRSAGLDTGVLASHGGISGWEIRNTLVMGGAGLKHGFVDPLPSGNVDLAPTLGHLLGLEPDPSQDGRVLCEALEGGPDPADMEVGHAEVERTSHGRRFTLQVSTVDGRRYLDVGRVEGR
ncbi:MAG: alkaline phosphatase family protein [Chloroflexi bacterium]|nr:alkaline phosphatase family protein [Chloroflexota bacterium]